MNKEKISIESIARYKEIQQNPICPICNKKYKELNGLALHFNRYHREHEKFSEWFKSEYPNYCKCCGNQIVTRIQDAYKVRFCGLKCSQRKEFYTNKRWEAQKIAGVRFGKSGIGKKKSFSEKHLEYLRQRAKVLGRKSAEHIAKYGHPFKGKKHSAECRKRMSEGHRRNRKHSWKGNFTKFQQIVRAELYKLWTRLCLERDNFKCQKCGDGGDLTVHHIIPFRELILEVLNLHPELSIINYEHKWILQKACLSYPKLLDLDNGKTLCIKCHRKEHRKAA